MTSFIGTAADAQTALVLLHNALAHPQTQSGAFGIFCGKERLKDLRHVFRRNAAAIVGHNDPYAFTLLPVMRVAHADIDVSRALK